MSENNDKHLKDFIKQCIKETFSLDKKETKKEIPFRKLIDIDEENTKDFDKILQFVVNKETGQAGLIINNTLRESWNKNLPEILLDNIEASFILLKEQILK